MEANYFTVLWWLLPYINMNQPWVFMCLPVLYLTPQPPPPKDSLESSLAPQFESTLPLWGTSVFALTAVNWWCPWALWSVISCIQSYWFKYYAMLCYAKSLQSCPTLCDPIEGSPPGSAIPGILQARILEWVAISFSSAWKRKVKVKSLSRVRLLATPWTAAYQAPPSMGFSRQEYRSGVPLPFPDLNTNHI